MIGRMKAVAVLLMTVLLPSLALAEVPPPVGPIYNPHTKSYFQLWFDLVAPESGMCHWGVAYDQARQKVYKGVHGRLAVVKDRETHEFLRDNFTIKHGKQPFIGLRFMCTVRELLWVDGDIQERGSFTPWHPKWSFYNADCVGGSAARYMPIWYTAHEGGFLWQAVGVAKDGLSYFVEFPTGGP